MPSFQKIIDILSNAFSILDFSYIVSGGFTLGIVLFDLHYHYYEFFIRNISITIVCGIFLAYICGLSSWIIGRLIRKIVQNTDKDFEETYDRTMNALASNALSLSVSDKKLAYSYMWIELHKKEEAKEQIIFMNRMWVMQAVFEGLIFSFIVAIGVLIDLKGYIMARVHCHFRCIVIIGMVVCYRSQTICQNPNKRSDIKLL